MFITVEAQGLDFLCVGNFNAFSDAASLSSVFEAAQVILHTPTMGWVTLKQNFHSGIHTTSTVFDTMDLD